MKNGTKRVLSLLMAVILVFSLGAASFAINIDDIQPIPGGSQVPGELPGGVTDGTELKPSQTPATEATTKADSLTITGTDKTKECTALELYAGKTATLNAVIMPEGYDCGIKWESADSTKVAISGAAINSSVVISAVAATAENEPVNITCTVKGADGNDIIKTVAVTVKADTVKSVAISGTGVTAGQALLMKKGAEVQLTGTTTYLSGKTATDSIRWSSSAPLLVSYTTAGKINAKAAGTSTVTATSTVDDTKSASLTVNVYEVKEISAALNAAGTKAEATVVFTDGYTPTAVEKTEILKSLTWNSSSSSVATIANDGTITNVGVGTTTLTATLDGKTATVSYEVKALTISGAPAAGETINIYKGGSRTFTATYPKVDGAAIEWTVTGNGFEIDGDANKASVKVKTTDAAENGNTATLTATLKKGSSAISSASVSLKVVAAVEATTITLDKSTASLTVGGTTTVGYTLTPSGANYSDISYVSSDPTVASVSSAGLVTALKAGTTNIKAVLTKTDGTTKIESGVCAVTVKAASTTKNYTATVTTSSSLSMATVKSSMSSQFTTLGGTTANAKITLTLPTSTTYGTLYKTSSATSSNKVESATEYTLAEFAKFTLKTTSRTGSYAFNYTLTDGTYTLTGKVTVTIGSQNADVTINLKDDDTYGFNSTDNDEKTSVYSAIRSAVYDIAGSYPSYIKFGSASGSSYGTMYDDDEDVYSKNTYYSLTELKSFTFEPAKKGTWSVSYTAYSSKSSSADLASGTLYIVVPSASSSDTVTVNLDSNDETYSFNSKTDEDGVSAYSAIRSFVYDEADEYPSYIKFGTASGSTYGTLYDDEDDAVSKNTRYSMSELKDFTFEPKEKKGTYSIDFTAYSSTSSSSKLAEGTLEIVVPSGSTKGDTITITLDDDDPYEFSTKTEENGVSAFKAIATAVKKAAGETYDYLKFTSVNSSTSVGKLYANEDEDGISKNTKYYNDEDASKSVYDLYFVPKADGTYECEFTAYNDDNDELGDFTLEIVVGEASSSGDGDIYVNVVAGKTVTFGEDLFETWFKAEAGSNYKLAYVTLDDVDSSKGTFKHSSTTFDPDGDIKFYTDSFTGTTGSSAKYLKNVKYTAASSTGCIEVEFTCYGGTTTSKYNTEKSGILYIFVTDDTVKSINYTVSGSKVELKESDFLSVYKTAMDSSSSSTKYYIELLNVPSKGNLYYDYTSASKPGTKLTSSNIGNYMLYVNGSSSNKGIDDITYVPATSATGTVSVDYIAYSSSGTALYTGTVNFKYGAASKSMTCYSDGYTFKATDFYSSADSDPIKTVAFSQPAYGKLMLNYTNGYGTALTSSTTLYTAGSVKNAYAISAVTYVPSSGFSGSVSINYSAVTESGSVVNGTITMTVKTKTASSTFTDVTASGVGTWAADSIDYAKAWGLVTGTGTTTFSPNATMTRGMLVTVLYRAAGSPSVSGTCKFTDVPQSQYYYNAIIWASNNGIASGMSTTKFNPDGVVTREQVATLMYNFAKYKGLSTTAGGSLSDYTDKGSVSTYATTAMTWAVSNGYITSTSTSAKVLSPAASATRAQVCVMLHRFLTDF